MAAAAERSDRDRTRSALLAALRKPRAEATREVDLLLITESRQTRDERREKSLSAQMWQESVQRRLAELDDEPSTGYGLGSAREGLNASMRAAQKEAERVQAAFDDRRSAFADALREVRDSRKVLLSDDAASEIRMLNADGYLARQLGMEPDEFESYYGGSGDVRVKGQQERSVVAGPPTAPIPVAAPPRRGIDFSRGTGTRVFRTPAPALQPAQAQARAEQPSRQPVALHDVLEEAVLPPEPEPDDEPGFGF